MRSLGVLGTYALCPAPVDLRQGEELSNVVPGTHGDCWSYSWNDDGVEMEVAIREQQACFPADFSSRVFGAPQRP